MPRSGAALVAVGGYGRRELSPGSDLDVLLLRPAGTCVTRDAAELADRIWYPVWDSGVRLDHSVRTPAEARRLAADDLRVAARACSTCGTWPATSVSPRRCAPACSPTGAGFASKRLPELLDSLPGARRARRRAGLLARARPQGVARRAARPGRCSAPSPPRGSPTRRTPASTTRTTPCSTYATPCTPSPAGPPTGSCCRSRTPSRTHLGLLDADQLLRQVAASGRTVAYAST